MHVYILFEGVNSHSQSLSGEAILSLKSNGLGKSAKPINVSSIFSDDNPPPHSPPYKACGGQADRFMSLISPTHLREEAGLILQLLDGGGRTKLNAKNKAT